MKKIYVGKIVSTHGIKGELKIVSHFPYKEKIFMIGNLLIIEDKNYQIKTYRHHKIYDMVTLDDYHNINEVEFLINKKVYFEKDKLELEDDEILDEDLITYKVILEEDSIGEIKEIFLASPTNKILRIVVLEREVLVPWNSPNIIKVDKKEKKLYVKLIEGMIE